MDIRSYYAKVCEQAARAGGKELLRLRGAFRVQEKAPADLMTDADLASQRAIFDVLSTAFPTHRLLGEEEAKDAENAFLNRGYTWIVDPLDGTTNYVHDLENYCVSVALHDSQQLVTGVIYDPIRDHCYRATRGGGAFLNDAPIQVSSVTSIGEALISVSFPPRVARGAMQIEQFVRVLTACQAVRRLGSAALNLCYVASGRLDGYWASALKPWDVAAGFLIVEEAGGHVTELSSGGTVALEDPKFVATGQRILNDRLRELLAGGDV